MPLLNAAGYAVPTAPSVETPPSAGGSYQNIQAPRGAFGEFTAEALSRFSEQAERASSHWTNIQDLHDRIATDEQTNLFDDSLNKILYGDPNNPDDVGYMGLQGKNAVEQRGRVRQQIDDLIARHRANAQTVNQQHMFDQASRARRNQALAHVGSHFDTEYKNWGASVTEAGARNGIARAATAAANNDFNEWKAALDDTTTKLAQSLAMRGVDPEVIKSAVQQTTQMVAEDWIVTRAVKDPVQAREFLEQNKELFGTRYPELSQKVEKAANDKIEKDIADGVDPKRPNYRVTPNTGGFRAPPGRLIQGATPQEQILLNEIRHRESGGDYKKLGPTNDHGAYQFQDPTWREATAGTGLGGQYAHASDAPDHIQDANALWLLRNRGTTPWKASGPYPQYRTAGATANPAVPSLGGPGNVRQPEVPTSTGGTPGYPAPRSVPGAVPPADRGLPTTQAAAPMEVWGDSLGMGLNSRLQTPGRSTGGAQPSAILSDIKKQPEDSWKGKRVVLSSGSNGNDMGTVEDTVKYLKDRGADVVLVGYGPKFPQKNAALSAIGNKYGSRVVPAQDVDPKEGIHPGPGGYDKMVQDIRTWGNKTGLTTQQNPTLTPPGAAPPEPAPALPQGGSGGGRLPETAEEAGGGEGEALPPPDVLLKTPGGRTLTAVPLDPGESPDGEVPGLMQELERAAKDPRIEADPERWPGVVRNLRKKYNAAYQATMQQENLRKLGQGKVDREVGETYIQRLEDPTSAPSEREIMLDKRMSTEKRRELVSIVHSLNRSDPSPAVNQANAVDIIRRIGLEDGDPEKIETEKQLTQQLIDKKITLDTYRVLRPEFERANNTREAYIQRERTRLIQQAGPILNPAKRAAGSAVAPYLDETGGHAQREAAYADFVVQSLEAVRGDPKATRALLDPSPQNNQYLGRQELLQQYSEHGPIGKQIMERAAQVHANKPKAPIDRMTIKSNADIQKLLADGKLGPAGSQEAVEAARRLSIEMGFSRPPTTQETVAPPVR